MHITQFPLFDFEAFISQKSNNRLMKLLGALLSEKLLIALEQEDWTGRKGYPVRGMWSALIGGLFYQCGSIAAIVRLLKRDRDIRMVCGFSLDDLSDDDAFSRFLKKLVKHSDLLDECLN